MEELRRSPSEIVEIIEPHAILMSYPSKRHKYPSLFCNWISWRYAALRNPGQSPNPYIPFGVFAGLPFWGGSLILLAAAPGIGKTSWLLRMLFESASPHIPSAIGCHEAAR